MQDDGPLVGEHACGADEDRQPFFRGGIDGHCGCGFLESPVQVLALGCKGAGEVSARPQDDERRVVGGGVHVRHLQGSFIPSGKPAWNRTHSGSAALHG